MNAKGWDKQLMLYGMDLLCLIAKHYYDGLTMPSEIYKEKQISKQTAKEIKDQILEKLGGE